MDNQQTIVHYPWQEQVEIYMQQYPHEMDKLDPLLRQMKMDDHDMLDRKTVPGHITASGIVIERQQILLVFHPFFEAWLQPGGHVEAGETPVEAAMREVLEETGMTCHLDPWHELNLLPIDIAVHTVPANLQKKEPSHLHYDFRYVLKIDNNIALRKEKVHKIDWRELSEIEEANLKRCVGKLRTKK